MNLIGSLEEEPLMDMDDMDEDEDDEDDDEDMSGEEEQVEDKSVFFIWPVLFVTLF